MAAPDHAPRPSRDFACTRGGVHTCLAEPRPAALAARGAAVAADHVGGGRRLVEEDEHIGVELGLSLEPVLALGPHIRPLLLGGVERVFF